MVTFCFSSAISRLDDNESSGPAGEKSNDRVVYFRKSNLERGLRSRDHLSQNVFASGLF